MATKAMQAVSEDELLKIDKDCKNITITMSASMSYVRKTQGWTFEQLAKRFAGINAATWQRYMQASYDKMRPLHMVAAYSWFTMLPLACFYRNLSIVETAYPNLDTTALECLTCSGLLTKKQFGAVINHIYEQVKNHHKSIEKITQDDFECVNRYNEVEIAFPQVLDIDEFAQDYYYSFAKGLIKFRNENKITIETMAHVLNLSSYRYKQCEKVDNPVPIPVEVGARLLLGFRLKNALIFTTHMRRFPKFHQARYVQEARLSLFTELLKLSSKVNKQQVQNTMSTMSSIIKEMYQNRNKLDRVIESLNK